MHYNRLSKGRPNLVVWSSVIMDSFVISIRYFVFEKVGRALPARSVFLLWGLIFGLLFYPLETHAKTSKYRKARRPIPAQTSGQARLRSLPSTKGRILTLLPGGTSLIVRGVKGGWFQTEAAWKGKQYSGWIYRSRVKLIKSKVRRSRKATSPQTSSNAPSSSPPNMKSERSPQPRLKISRPFRLGVWGGLSRKVRGLDDHFHVGTDLMWGFGSGVSLGTTVETGFHNLFLVAMTPSAKARFPWPILGPVRVYALGGFPIYYLSESGNKDLLMGLRAGLELDYSLGAMMSRNTRFFARVWSDFIVLGEDRVSIPLMGVLGLSFRF